HRRIYRKELQERLAKAGVAVDEARLTHLAYAPEIAQAVLRRQQAEAGIAARQKIVHGAVSLVDIWLERNSRICKSSISTTNGARRWSTNSWLCFVGESEVHPIVNTGTLYT